jgi:NAD-specific glutamate dehydrogenase
MFNFKGFGNKIYYRLVERDRQYYMDYSGRTISPRSIVWSRSQRDNSAIIGSRFATLRGVKAHEMSPRNLVCAGMTRRRHLIDRKLLFARPHLLSAAR